MTQRAASMAGKVYLVGAGPGDPGLITWRGVECLRAADLVLYDYLANARLLVHASPGAELVCLGRHGQGRLMAQCEINARMVEAARQGRCVVRLKCGDPMIFARGAEEVDALAEANVPFEVVPGITAALAASSFAGIPLTHRDVSSAVALVTGQESSAKAAEAIDYGRLADFPGTLVFYMAVTSVRQWAADLLDRGMPGDTPVAMVRRCSWPDQTIWRCRLADTADEVERQQLRPPIIFVVGAAADMEAPIGWFTQRPLFGQRFLVTRPRDQNETLQRQLEALGAETLAQPAIEIGPPDDWAAVDAALSRIESYDWLVFSSVNGVQYLLDRLVDRHGDLRRLAGVRLAAIGPATVEQLQRYHLRADLAPHEYRAEALAEALAHDARGKRFLLARASRGREVLREILVAAGADVEQVVVYGSRDVPKVDADIRRQLAQGAIDWVTVTSSAIARSLVQLLGDDLRRAKLISISPITSATLRELGFEPTVEATEYTVEGMIDATLRFTEAG